MNLVISVFVRFSNSNSKPQQLNALVLFLFITSEIFQLTHQYRYQFVGEVRTDIESIIEIT